MVFVLEEGLFKCFDAIANFPEEQFELWVQFKEFPICGFHFDFQSVNSFSFLSFVPFWGLLVPGDGDAIDGDDASVGKYVFLFER